MPLFRRAMLRSYPKFLCRVVSKCFSTVSYNDKVNTCVVLMRGYRYLFKETTLERADFALQ